MAARSTSPKKLQTNRTLDVATAIRSRYSAVKSTTHAASTISSSRRVVGRRSGSVSMENETSERTMSPCTTPSNARPDVTSLVYGLPPGLLRRHICRRPHDHAHLGGGRRERRRRQTIGLGQAPRIETLDVFWPMTGEHSLPEPVGRPGHRDRRGRSCVHDRPGRDVPSGRRVTYLATVKSAAHSCGPHTSRSRPWSGVSITTDADSGRDESLIESPTRFDCE